MATFDFGASGRGCDPVSTITIREHFAALAMSSLSIGSTSENAARRAVEMADALLKQLLEELGGV